MDMLGEQVMAIRSLMWERIRYAAFLGLFVSLLTAYWTYSYEEAPNPESVQLLTYPLIETEPC